MDTASGLRLGQPALRIATAPVNWNNDDLTDWRPPAPFLELLDRMRAAGYTATELGSNFPTRVEDLMRALIQRDMSLCGAYQWLPLRDPDQLTRSLGTLEAKLTLLHANGCRDLIIADGLTPERVALAGHVPEDGSATLDDAGMRQIADGAARTASLAMRHSIAVHYHNHVGTYVETPDDVRRLVPLLDERGVDLCFDTGHFAYGGGAPAAFVAAHAARIGYLHLKDVDGQVLQEAKLQRWSFLKALRHVVFAPLGDGIANVPAIVASLRKNDYAGWIVVEQDTCAGDATETAQRNLDYLHAIVLQP